MQIEIVKVGTAETVPTGKGRPYQKLEVLYRLANDPSKQGTKKLVSFKNPLVFKQMKDAKVGEVYEVESIKSDDGQYTEWKSANVVGNNQQEVAPVKEKAATGELPAAKSATTPIKLAVQESDRQRWIVRQSSLERAVAYHSFNTNDSGFLVDDVLKTAEQFEGWVFRPVPQPSAVAAPAEVKKSVGRPRKVVAAPIEEDDIPSLNGEDDVPNEEVA